MKNNAKNIFAITLAVIIALSLAACGSKGSGSLPTATMPSNQNENSSVSDDTSSVAEDKTNFTDDMYAAKRNGKWGVINDNGDVIIDFAYTDCHEEISDGLWSVKNNPSWGAVDAKNKVIISFEYDELGSFKDGIYPAKKDGYWGVVSNKNEKMIPFEYDEIGIFNNGLCPAKKSGYWGIINNKNEKIVDFQYDAMGTQMENGLIGVSLNGAGGVIDKSGKYLISLNKDHGGVAQVLFENILFSFSDSIDMFSGTENFCLFDLTGKEIISGSYYSNSLSNAPGFGKNGGSELSRWGDSHFRIFDGSTNRIINTRGDEIWNLEKHTQISLKEQVIKTTLEYVDASWYKIFVTAIASDSIHYTWSNLINIDGSFLLNKWESNATSRGFSATANKNYIAIIFDDFDWQGAEHIYSKDGDLKKEFADSNDVMQFWNDKYVLYRGNGNVSQIIYDLEKGTEFEYGEIVDCLGHRNNYSTTESFPSHVAIVKDIDKIFYGLFVNDKLAIPCEYNSISYNANSDIFTLQKGNVSKQVRIARNGRIIELN